jgi:hypothetical protein
MARIRNPEWQASLEETKYPFEPGASLVNEAGDVIPANTFLDAHLYPIGGAVGMFLSKITVTSSEVVVYISDSSQFDIASATYPVNQSQTYIRFVDAYSRPAGIAITDSVRLGALSSLGVGDHEFSADQTRFCGTVCMPTPEIGVRGIVLDDGSVLSGEIWMVGENGIVLSRENYTTRQTCAAESTDQSIIRLDVVGDPLFLRKLCDPNDLFATPKFIKTIKIKNGNYEFDYYPDERGYVYIQGNDSLATKAALRVSTSAEGKIELAVAGTPNYNL